MMKIKTKVKAVVKPKNCKNYKLRAIMYVTHISPLFECRMSHLARGTRVSPPREQPYCSMRVLRPRRYLLNVNQMRASSKPSGDGS